MSEYFRDTLGIKMQSCIYQSCPNDPANIKDHNGISFHPFPEDGLLKIKWIEVIRIERDEPKWLPTPFTMVCSNHFRPQDLLCAPNEMRCLKEMAIPVLPDHMKDKMHLLSPECLHGGIVSVADLTTYYNSVFNVPIETNFDSEIKKLKAEKRQLKMINTNVYRKNRKLEAKWHRLKNVIADLKKTHKCTLPSRCSLLEHADVHKEEDQENSTGKKTNDNAKS